MKNIFEKKRIVLMTILTIANYLGIALPVILASIYGMIKDPKLINQGLFLIFSFLVNSIIVMIILHFMFKFYHSKILNKYKVEMTDFRLFWVFLPLVVFYPIAHNWKILFKELFAILSAVILLFFIGGNLKQKMKIFLSWFFYSLIFIYIQLGLSFGFLFLMVKIKNTLT